MNQPHVAIVGATGAVGVEMLLCLEQRNFPLGKLKLLASARSAGKRMKFRGEEVVVEELTHDSFAGRGHRAVQRGRRHFQGIRPLGRGRRRGGHRQLVRLPHGRGRAAGGAGNQSGRREKPPAQHHRQSQLHHHHLADGAGPAARGLRPASRSSPRAIRRFPAPAPKASSSSKSR